MPIIYINVGGKELEVSYSWCGGGPGSREQPAESSHVDEILEVITESGDSIMPVLDELLDKSGWDYICKEVEGTHREHMKQKRRL